MSDTVRHHMGSVSDGPMARALFQYLQERFSFLNLTLIELPGESRPFGIYLMGTGSQTAPDRRHDPDNSKICEAIRGFEAGWNAKPVHIDDGHTHLTGL